METVTTRDLRSLMETPGQPCVSVYLPTHVGGTNGQQDAVRLKNLVREAERKLIEFGCRAPDAKALVEPLRQFPQEPAWWSQRGRGLALFLAPNMFRHLHLPVSVEEQVTINRRFLIKPLLALVDVSQRFWLLALSQGGVQLFEGQPYALQEVEVPDLPPDMRAALNYDPFQRNSQAATATRGGAGKSAAGFHGHSGERDSAKEAVERYFRIVDAALQPVWQNQRLPLVLAGVDYLLPIYRSVTSYPFVLPDEIHGNVSQLALEDLLARAWPLVEAECVRFRNQELARFQELVGTGKASGDMRQILPATERGHVQTLLVDPAATCWGTFVPESGAVEIRDVALPGDDDLLDLAAVQTLARRGTVLTAPAEELPALSVAAVFRF